MDEGLLPGVSPGIYTPRPATKIFDYGGGIIAPSNSLNQLNCYRLRFLLITNLNQMPFLDNAQTKLR